MPDINEYEPNIFSKQITWILKKATPTITLSKSSLSLNTSALTGTFTITRSGNGTISVSSSNTSIATVSLSGTTATVTAKVNGTCTITVNVIESDNYLSRSASLSVSVSLASTTLNDNSWNTISQIAQVGTASSYWSVGDTKNVTLNGNTTNSSNAIKTISGTYKAVILGFNHNSSYEGSNKIHFILEKNVCFYPYRMNESTTADGGWNGSKMKQTTMVEFKNCLPADLRTVLKNVTKYTHNYTGGSRNNNGGYVTATTEQVFLLSEFEVSGKRSCANSYEQNKQAQYAFYANGNSKKRYKDTDGKVYSWSLRSVGCNREVINEFCGVSTAEGVTYFPANTSIGIAPAFVV